MEAPLRCPDCGHELSMWSPAEPGRGEVIAMHVADRIASWWFPTALLVLIGGWCAWNVAGEPFEPYPVIIFAVISAVLATLAAMQGPLILLAQRRASERDRMRDEEALRVSVNAEADLHRLEQKLDAVVAAVSARA